MQTKLISEVLIPTARQRTQVDETKFQELKRSIQNEGLLHAIILSPSGELVAGATRLRAIHELASAGNQIKYNSQDIPIGHVPFTVTHKATPHEIFRIELEENLRRENLSHIDEAMAISKLARMLQEQKPELIPGSGVKEQVTNKEVAATLGEISGDPRPSDEKKVADAILVEQWKNHPDVKRASSLREGARIAKRLQMRAFMEVMGQMEQEEKEEKHKIILGTCQDILPTLPAGTVDVVIVDPPYGIGADSFGEQATKFVGEHTYKDDATARDIVLICLEKELSRLCKPDAALFLFHDILDFDYIKDFIPDDWYIWPTPLIWHKPNRGHAPQPKRGPQRHYEAILYAICGNREVRKVGHDVLSFAVSDNRSHSAGKPPELYAELLSWIAYPGDVVLDFCAGSGPIIDAAETIGCSAIAVEMDPVYVQIMRDKLKGEPNAQPNDLPATIP